MRRIPHGTYGVQACGILLAISQMQRIPATKWPVPRRCYGSSGGGAHVLNYPLVCHIFIMYIINLSSHLYFPTCCQPFLTPPAITELANIPNAHADCAFAKFVGAWRIVEAVVSVNEREKKVKTISPFLSFVLGCLSSTVAIGTRATIDY